MIRSRNASVIQFRDVKVFQMEECWHLVTFFFSSYLLEREKSVSCATVRCQGRWLFLSRVGSSIRLTSKCFFKIRLSRLCLRPPRSQVFVMEMRVVARSGTDLWSFSTLYVCRQPKSCTSFSATSAHFGPTPVPCWQLSNISRPSLNF